MLWSAEFLLGSFAKELDEWAYKKTEYYVFLIDFQNILKGTDED